tara:strand:+ start:92 stop:505 length:414 start_codon:yes stop_codon:yes gene_type:complete
MATRATIRFATREEGVPFDKHPEKWHAQFYNHYDGYPEGLGVEIAKSFTNYNKINGWEVEALDIVHGDIEYLYYVWQCHGKSEPWISIFQMIDWSVLENNREGKCIFVGTPDMLLKKYAPEETDLDRVSKQLCEDTN